MPSGTPGQRGSPPCCDGGSRRLGWGRQQNRAAWRRRLLSSCRLCVQTSPERGGNSPVHMFRARESLDSPLPLDTRRRPCRRLILLCYAPNEYVRHIFCDRLERVQSVRARHHLDISSRLLDTFAAHEWTRPRSKISVEGLCVCKARKSDEDEKLSSTSVRANARCSSLVARCRWARGARPGDLRFVRCVVGCWLDGRRLRAA